MSEQDMDDFVGWRVRLLDALCNAIWTKLNPKHMENESLGIFGPHKPTQLSS